MNRLLALPALLALLATAANAAEPPTGTVHSGKLELETPKKSRDKRAGETNHAPFSIFVPDEVEVVRGVVFNPFYEKTVEQEHWRTAAASWDFALMGANLFGVRAEDIGEVTLDGLALMAKASSHPEIANAPICLVGMSAGGGMSVNIAATIPESILAAAPVCLEVGPKNEASHAIPMLTIFGERDGKQMEKLMAKFPAAAEAGAKWAIAVQWGRKHEFHKANNLIMPFFDAVIRERYPEQASPADGPVELLSHPDNGTWFGAPGDWKEAGSAAQIQPWVRQTPEFAAKARCWFPDDRCATVWQAFTFRSNPRLIISEPPGLGGGQPFRIHDAGKPLAVTVALAANHGIKVIRLAVDGRLLPKKREMQMNFKTPPLRPGIHTLVAVGVDERNEMTFSEPHTILVR